jgi:hypothetical protein
MLDELPMGRAAARRRTVVGHEIDETLLLPFGLLLGACAAAPPMPSAR